jgi:hypothetical protein
MFFHPELLKVIFISELQPLLRENPNLKNNFLLGASVFKI